jgi:hypothetical protein
VLKPKADDPYRLQGFHDCVGGVMRCVIEVDAPDFPPPDLSHRIEPAEMYPPAHKKNRS